MMSQETVSEVCDCGGARCPTCSLCEECVAGHNDGYGGELYAVIDTLDHLMDTHKCDPPQNSVPIMALLEAAESALYAVMGMTGHQRA